MPRSSPLAELHEAFVRDENERRARAVAESARGDAAAVALVAHRAAIEWIPYGPDEAAPERVRQLVGAYGPVEPEYAAIRRGAALIDAFQRSVLRVRGKDRRDFLDRMLTQDLRPLSPGRCVESFWLNRKGRIDADMLLVETGDEILADVDCFAAAPARESLERFVFSEEVSIEDRGDHAIRLSMHGPRAGEAVESAGLRGAAALAPGQALSGAIAGAAVTAARRDQCGAAGFELFLDAEHATAVWRVLAAVARPVGWHAYNTARIEGGTPLFRVDFGAESLPHETGVVASRVSFRKGCYLGQEIVARMESLGAPKQQIVGFRVHEAAGGDTPPRAAGDAPGIAAFPVAGAQLRRPNEPMGTPIGVVTSSTAAPILRAAIGFATVRSALAETGTRLATHAEGEAIEVEVLGPPASFLDSASRPAAGAAAPASPSGAAVRGPAAPGARKDPP